MRNFKISSADWKAKGLKLLTVLILLFAYLVGTLEVSPLHKLFHDPADEQVLHSKINEQNSCHQVLYHNAKEESCEHRSHITAFKECSFCQLSIQSFYLFDSKSKLEFDFYSEPMIALTQSFQLCEPCLLIAPRAPPVS